jgi:glycosyltransferase involved in cell wall biosynthesis
MHIGYLSHYFLPEFAAPAVRIEEFGRVWMERGHRVSVLTGFPQYPHGTVFPEYAGKWFMREELNGFEVTRTPIFTSPRGGALRTGLNYLSFPARAAGAALLGKVPRPDVWIATSPPLFVGLGALALKARQKRPLVFEVRDLWPDSIRDVGELKPGRLLDTLYALERRMYRSADAVVTVVDAVAEQIAAKGGDRAHIMSIPHGAEVAEPRRPSPEERAAARQRLGVREDAFVVGYVGTHGRSQRLAALAPAAAALAGENVQFVFVGDGAEKAELQKALSKAGDTGALTLASQPREAMPELYALCDLCLVPLGDFPVISRTIPSKLFEIMGHARPFVALVRGDAACLARDSGAGEVVEPEDAEALTAAVRRMRALGPEALGRMGEAGREFLRAGYTREHMALRYLGLLESLLEPGVAAEPAPIPQRIAARAAAP